MHRTNIVDVVTDGQELKITTDTDNKVRNNKEVHLDKIQGLSGLNKKTFKARRIYGDAQEKNAFRIPLSEEVSGKYVGGGVVYKVEVPEIISF